MLSKKVMLLCATTALMAGSPKAVSAEPDYDTPPEKVEELKAKSLKGDPVAQYELGWLTVLGWAGVPRDRDKGHGLIMRSAVGGYDEAQITVASQCLNGKLTGKIDLPAAASWLHKAAEQGNQVACFHLANLYQEGNDIFQFMLEIDGQKTTKVELLKKDAEISRRFWDLSGVSISEVESLVALHARIANGDWRAHKDVAELLRECAPKKLNVNLCSEFHSLKYSAHLFDDNLKKAANGDTQAMVEVARNYGSPGCPGRPKKNPDEQQRWLNKAAQAGSIDALYELGSFYSQNERAKDTAKSFAYFKEAAETGHAAAMCSLAIAYEAKGDLLESSRWMIKAAEAGDSSSWFYLGHRYQNGKGVPANFVKAYAWFSISSTDEKEGSDGAAKRRLKELATQMTPETIAEAHALAAQLWEKIEKKSSKNPNPSSDSNHSK